MFALFWRRNYSTFTFELHNDFSSKSHICLPTYSILLVNLLIMHFRINLLEKRRGSNTGNRTRAVAYWVGVCGGYIHFLLGNDGEFESDFEKKLVGQNANI